MVPVLLHRLSTQLSCLRALQGRCRTFAALPQEANDDEEKIKVTVLQHAKSVRACRCKGLIPLMVFTELNRNAVFSCSQVNPYKLHRLDEGPEREVETSKTELLEMFRSMYTVSSSNQPLSAGQAKRALTTH